MSQMEQHLKVLTTKVQSEVLVRGKLFNGLVATKKLTLGVKEENVLVNSVEEDVVYREVPLKDLCGWALIIKPNGNEQSITLTSHKPKIHDEENIQQLVSILNKPTLDISGSNTSTNDSKPKNEGEEELGISAKLDESGSGSGTEILDLDLSNSGEK